MSSLFVLDYRTGAIAFERIQNKISANGFMGHFVALLNTAKRREFEGEIIRLAREYREFLNVVDKVTRESFEVYPTNPRDRPIFRPLDRGLKASNATRERRLMENEDEGLTMDPPATRDEETDNPAIQGIEMNEEGYGDGYKIDGERDGRSVRFVSKGGGLLRDVIEDAPETLSGAPTHSANISIGAATSSSRARCLPRRFRSATAKMTGTRTTTT